MSVDKNYCMSSYLAFRYIEDSAMDFYEGLHHKNITPSEERIYVRTAQDIDWAIGMQMDERIQGGVNLASSFPEGWIPPSWPLIWAGAMPIPSAF